MRNSTRTDGVQSTLDQLKVGESAIVSGICSHAAPHAPEAQLTEISRRLKELGFVAGESIRVLDRGYFGGEPVAVRVGQSTFALRNFEAALIGITK